MKQWKSIQLGSLPEAAGANIESMEAQGWTYVSSAWNGGFLIGIFSREAQERETTTMVPSKERAVQPAPRRR